MYCIMSSFKNMLSYEIAIISPFNVYSWIIYTCTCTVHCTMYVIYMVVNVRNIFIVLSYTNRWGSVLVYMYTKWNKDMSL